MSEELEGIPLSVHRADQAVQAFDDTENGKFESVYDDDRETLLTDLLTDLMHWADANDLDFEEQLRVAQGHHDAEEATTEGGK